MPNQFSIDTQPQQSGAQSFAQGYGLAGQISSDIMAANQQRQSTDRETQKQADMQALMQNHSPQAIAEMNLKYPEMAGPIKNAFTGMDAQEKQRRVGMAIPIYSAAVKGRIDIAKKLLEQQAVAAENGGNAEEADLLRKRIEMADADPEAFKFELAQNLSAAMGEDKFVQTLGGLTEIENANAMAPMQRATEAAQARKYGADALKSETEAQYAGPLAEANLSNISRDNATNEMNAASAQETNRLKQLELTQNMDEKQKSKEVKKIEDEANYQKGQAQVDGTLSTITEALSHPGLLKSGGNSRRAYGSLPSDERAFINLLKTLDAQNFRTAVSAMKGMGLGALSDAEGVRLSSMMGSLDPYMKNEDLIKVLNNMKNLIETANAREAKTRSAVRNVTGAPDYTEASAGGTASGTASGTAINNTRYAVGLKKMGASPDDISAFLASRRQ